MMLARPDRDPDTPAIPARTAASATEEHGQSDADVTRDQTDAPPLMKLWEPEEFDGLLGEFVNEHAPRLFAVTQVYREHLDARIVAWSFAFDDHADLVTTDQETWMSLQSPDNALLVFARPPHVSARIVWPGPPGVQDQ